jgi:uncharacterized protein YkwD
MKQKYLYTALILIVFLFNGICVPYTHNTRPDEPERPPKTTPDTSGDALKETGLQAHRQTNEYRKRRNLPPLAWSEVVYKECLDHSRDMTRSGSLSHDGFQKRVANIRSQVAAAGAAENVAYNWNLPDPATTAVQGWIESPGHHANLVGDYTHAAVAVARASNGAYYLTQMFYKAQ